MWVLATACRRLITIPRYTGRQAPYNSAIPGILFPGQEVCALHNTPLYDSSSRKIERTCRRLCAESLDMARHEDSEFQYHLVLIQIIIQE